MDNFGSFKWLTGDVNYVDHGGKWYRQVDERNYHVVELRQWAAELGERDGKGQPKYNVTLSEIDLGRLMQPNNQSEIPLDSALRSCGWERKNGDIVEKHNGSVVAHSSNVYYDAVCVEALDGYGNKARLEDLYGNNWRKLMREAIKRSRELDPLKHPRKHKQAMQKPANAIGTTTENMMLGNIFKKGFLL